MSYILLEYNGAWKLKVEEDFKWIEVDHQLFWHILLPNRHSLRLVINTLNISKGRSAANMKKTSVYHMWTRACLLCMCIPVQVLAIQSYSEGSIYIFKDGIYSILPVTNTQTLWRNIKTDKAKKKNFGEQRKMAMHLLFNAFIGHIKIKQIKVSLFTNRIVYILWIFSATTTGFSFLIFAAASAL